MPGKDGTGPRGQGAMMGRGMGYCAVNIGEKAPPDRFMGMSRMPRPGRMPENCNGSRKRIGQGVPESGQGHQRGGFRRMRNMR